MNPCEGSLKHQFGVIEVRRLEKSLDEVRSWDELRRGEMSSAEVRRRGRSWEEVARGEKSRDELRRDGQRWDSLRRVEKSWEEVKRGELRWEEMKKMRTAEKGCENWEELRSGGHSWKVVRQGEDEFREQRFDDVRPHSNSFRQNLSFDPIVQHSLLLETSATRLARVLLVFSLKKTGEREKRWPPPTK